MKIFRYWARASERVDVERRPWTLHRFAGSDVSVADALAQARTAARLLHLGIWPLRVLYLHPLLVFPRQTGFVVGGFRFPDVSFTRKPAGRFGTLRYGCKHTGYRGTRTRTLPRPQLPAFKKGWGKRSGLRAVAVAA